MSGGGEYGINIYMKDNFTNEYLRIIKCCIHLNMFQINIYIYIYIYFNFIFYSHYLRIQPSLSSKDI